jgi:CRISPR/Cas system CSM-associated protein Csm3 (group 7 of RAMP superfamily)
MSEQELSFFAKQLKNSRKIVGRIVIEGDLLLETPTRFGNGDRDGLVDLTLARDPLDGRPLLPGASVAGALRSYLRTREVGFRTEDRDAGKTKLLFGEETARTGQEKSSSQSYLVAYDSLADTAGVELRDGVTIDPKTRTAVDRKKYDLELLAAGTVFPLRLELLVVAGKEATLTTALAMALQGFERGEIPMGARRRRGFGRCRVNRWQVRHYDFTKAADLIAWLEESNDPLAPTRQSGADIAALLGCQAAETALNRRERFTLDALFGIAGSLLIRSSTENPSDPDMVHLRSKRHSNGKSIDHAIVSGTSLAGALRGRALRIAQTIGNTEKAQCYINDLFGLQPEGPEEPTVASRLWVEESVIENPQDLVVSRVKLDRFTGGSFPTALFSEQPVFGLAETAVRLCLRVDSPTAADKGLLLLLLKDLWTEDLPLGGGASVGRGRLRGKCATLTSQENAQVTEWRIEQAGDRLAIQGDRDAMQACVTAFCKQVGGRA